LSLGAKERGFGADEAKNMKILCKNIRHDRAWKRRGHASKVGSNMPKSKAWHDLCCSGTTVRDGFTPFALQDWHDHAKLGTLVPRFQAVICYVFNLKAHGFPCCGTL